MRQVSSKIRKLLPDLKPGFLLLSDLGDLTSMDLDCAPEIGALMEMCSAGGMSTVVRVIPDPAKDIGFNVMSHFHLHPRVKTRIYASLAEAINSLLPESVAEAPAA